MAEKELRTGKVHFRVEPSKLARWQKTMAKLGVRDASDFFRDAIDQMCDMVDRAEREDG